MVKIAIIMNISKMKHARRGEFYQRFELRDGDCFGDDTWNDCENDRERVEFSSRPRQEPSGNFNASLIVLNWIKILSMSTR